MKKSNWKQLLISGLTLVALAAPAFGVAGEEHRHKKHQNMPEGGNATAYVLVSGAAILGGALLVRKQRSARRLQTN